MEITPAHWLAMFNLVKFASVQFQFDDVDEHEEGDEKYIHMTDFMARSFANTIMHHDNLPEKFTLVTHCHAGICRSSAVMQAALEYLFWINSPVIEAWFKTGRYVPNTWVRKKMRKAFTELKENPWE